MIELSFTCLLISQWFCYIQSVNLLCSWRCVSTWTHKNCPLLTLKKFGVFIHFFYTCFFIALDFTWLISFLVHLLRLLKKKKIKTYNLQMFSSFTSLFYMLIHFLTFTPLDSHNSKSLRNDGRTSCFHFACWHVCFHLVYRWCQIM